MEACFCWCSLSVLLLCCCVWKAEPCRQVTLVGLTLGCRGKRLVRSIKKGKLDLCSADQCGRLSWHVSETGCIVGLGWGWGGFLWHYWEPGIGGKEIEVETLRETQEEVETGGVRVTEGLRGGVALHSVLLRSAIDTQLCPNSFKWSSSLLGL